MKHRRVFRWLAVCVVLAFGAAACGGDDDSTAVQPSAVVEPVTAPEVAEPDEAAEPAQTAEPDEAAEPAVEEPVTAPEVAEPDEAAEPAVEEEPVAVAIVLNVPRNDQSWAQTAVEGLERLETAGEITLTVIEGASGDDPTGTRNIATNLAEAGNDLVIFHSFSFGETLLQLSSEFPDTNFAWAGGLGADYGGLAENVADYDQPFYQASYLAGILSAGLSESNKVGGMSGFDIPVCHAMMEAFALGYQEVHPDSELVATYVGSWIDTALTKEAALAQYEQGVEVINPCGVQDGAIQAAKDADGKVIGYVGDQTSLAEEHIPMSMIWNLDVVFGQMVDDTRDGTFQPGRFYELGVADGALSVVINPEYPGEIDPAAVARYDERLAQIEAGEFVVPYIPA